MPTAKTTAPGSAQAKTRARAASRRSTTASKRPTTAPRGAAATSKTSSAAERAVLIPVGAALIARERVLAGVNDAIDYYSSPTKTSAQLRRFERRGATARNRIEREVRKTRVRVERELRRRRQDGEELATRVQDRILSLV